MGFHAEEVEQSFTLNVYVGDEELDDVLGLEMAEGHFFSTEFPSDTSGAILNETAVRVLGYDDPLGKWVLTNSPPVRYPVIGVLRDFNYESLHSEVRPMVILRRKGLISNLSYIGVRFEGATGNEISSTAEKLWAKMLPGTPFDYTFLDDTYENLYRNEKQTGQVFSFLAILAIIVACLGLLGLAAFMTQQKTRQIAVRKVFGASVAQIVGLLSFRFAGWVLPAFVIACPFGWWIFPVSGLAALAIALITISSISYKAARMNPADALKHE